MATLTMPFSNAILSLSPCLLPLSQDILLTSPLPPTPHPSSHWYSVKAS